MKILHGFSQSRVSGKAGAPLVLCVLLLLGARADAVLLLNDTFSDGERLTQNLPTSARWFTGGATGTVTSSASGLTFTDTSPTKATAMAYFSPSTLSIGQSITLSFNYQFQTVANSDNAFMFGLYNSGGSRLTTDGLGFNNALFNNYTGVATSGVFGVDPSGPGRDHIEARFEGGNNLLSIGTYEEGEQYKQSGAATPGTLYAASMQVTRTAEGVTVESKVGNTDIVQNFSGTNLAKFDAVGIFSNGSTGSFTVDGVKVELTGLPEPSSFLALGFFGAMVFGGATGRKLKAALHAFREPLI